MSESTRRKSARSVHYRFGKQATSIDAPEDLYLAFRAEVQEQGLTVVQAMLMLMRQWVQNGRTWREFLATRSKDLGKKRPRVV